MWRFAITITFLAAFPASVVQAQWGTLKGRVEFDGDVPPRKVLVRGPAKNVAAGAVILDDSMVVDPNTKGVANVAIWLAKKPAEIHPDLVQPSSDTAIMQLKANRFDPHVLVLRTGQKLKLVNRDRFSQNARANTVKNSSFDSLLAPAGQKSDHIVLQWGKAERVPVMVTNGLVGWMTAFVIVVDHPYATVTDEDGNFELKDLPAGDHEFRLWHENKGWIVKGSVKGSKGPTLNIKAGELMELPVIKVTAQDLTRTER